MPAARASKRSCRSAKNCRTGSMSFSAAAGHTVCQQAGPAPFAPHKGSHRRTRSSAAYGSGKRARHGQLAHAKPVGGKRQPALQRKQQHRARRALPVMGGPAGMAPRVARRSSPASGSSCSLMYMWSRSENRPSWRSSGRSSTLRPPHPAAISTLEAEPARRAGVEPGSEVVRAFVGCWTAGDTLCNPVINAVMRVPSAAIACAGGGTAVPGWCAVPGAGGCMSTVCGGVPACHPGCHPGAPAVCPPATQAATLEHQLCAHLPPRLPPGASAAWRVHHTTGSA